MAAELAAHTLAPSRSIFIDSLKYGLPAVAVLASAACGTNIASVAPMAPQPVTKGVADPELPFTDQNPIRPGEQSPRVQTFLSDIGKAGCLGVKPGSDLLGPSELAIVHRLQKNADVSGEAEAIGTHTAYVLHDSAMYKDASCGAAFALKNVMDGCFGVYDAKLGKQISDGRLVKKAGPIFDPSECQTAPQVAAARAHVNSKAQAGGTH